MFNSGFRGKRAEDNQGTVNIQTSFVQNKYPQPTITGWSISGTDDTALNPAGGQTVLVNGTGFASGVAATVNGSTISPVTLVNPTQISFTSPALAGGSYSLIVYNSSGGAAILVPGLVYSSVPSYTTAAGSIGNIYETNSISTQVVATSDSAITYTLASGSLPSGATLYANGVITGTAPVDSASTTYTFGVTAIDAELQDVTRTFTLTINTDTVTWSNPSSNTSISLDNTSYSNTLSATSAAGKSITYTANSLPTGLTLSTATISGTPTVEGTSTTLLTATAATTNRTSQRTITWTVLLNDEYFKYVSLLLSGETTVTPFISDASSSSFGLTIKGDTKPVTFNPYQGGYYSNYFDGTGDYLTPPLLNFGTTDFTVEAWVCPTTAGDGANSQILYISTGAATRLAMRINSANKMDLYLNAVTPGVTTYTSNTVLVPNSWYHLAAVRSSGVVSLYVNGILDNTPSASLHDINQNDVYTYIGSIGASTQPFTGYISNFRITSTAVYTATFTPSTSPLTAISGTRLLTCQSNRFIDNSSNAYTIAKTGDVLISPNIPFTQNSSYSTYGSTYFDGTGDYLSVASNSAFAFGTGDFTVECWAYFTSVANFPTLTDSRANTSSTAGFNLGLSSAKVQLYTTSQLLIGSTTLVANTWYHIAVTRSSTTLKIWVNGVQDATVSNSTNWSDTTLLVGATPTPTNYMTGYISDLRLVKGTAVYTATFTPPTSPLTAIANTSLLTLQYNGGATNQAIIDNSNFNNIITRSGNATQGTFSPYSLTGWSTYFDGTGDYLTVPTNAALDFGTGDFTVEFWWYPTSIATDQGFLGGGNGAYDFVWRTSPAFNIGRINTAFDNTFAFTPVVNTWYHVAYSRSGTSLRVFVNGAQVGTTATNSISYGTNNFTAVIGGSTTADRLLSGYISNMRLVKGTGLYTSTFTPSTTPLTAIANTSLLTCQSNRFIDNSPNSFTLTRAGDVSVQAFSPFGSISEATPLSYSVYFSSSNFTIANNTALQLGSTYTVEVWCYLNSYGTNIRIFSDGSTNGANLDLGVGADGRVFFAGAIVYVGESYVLPLTTWTHIAAVVNAGTLSIYINGVSKTLSGTTTGYNHTNSGSKYIGAYNGNDLYWNGYISNLRWVKGTAVYTSNFTPSTTPLTAISGTSLLTCQSTTIKDNSTNAFTITASGSPKVYKYNPFGYTAQTNTSYTPSLHGGSAYFDGTGDYLTTSNISAWQFGTGDFTVEFWMNTNKTSGNIVGLTGGSTGYWNICMAGSILYFQYAYATTNIASVNPISGYYNSWVHVAWTRKSGTSYFFINGVLSTSVADTNNYNGSSGNLVVGYSIDYDPFKGYMSDLRITKGIALYTSNFVPPTQTLTNYSTTYPATLLLNFNNGGIIDQHSTNVLETVGNTQLSTSVKKYNNSSIYFDGTGDYLYNPSSINYGYGTGDFTIEFWLYLNSTGLQTILSHLSSNPQVKPHIYYSSGVRLYVNGGDVITGGTVTISTWTHIALSRSTTSTKLFINGTQSGSTYTDSNNYGTSSPLIIGDYSVPVTGTNMLNGYIDDLRITKGYARYTSNFTPPTGAFKTK